ncbi:unnamed protein product [Blepharisma stoltei]|uniref:FHA domain-containing protein n=1 Tax=Blepharisma stoltei TaxID=1481888 RepID=A0AAU9JQQ4_9CILI|nr:unnamed protein product [Blepharisma stoltei]
MGSGAFSCCDAIAASKVSEFSLASPKNKTLREPSELRSSFIPSSIQSQAEFRIPNIDQHIMLLQSLSSSKSLRLKVINSGNIEKGTLLNIRATGLIGSKRNSNDGYTYFGSKRKLNGAIVNDFVIPLKDQETKENHRGRHFVIYYRIDKDSYWIRDLSKGFGAFVRLDYALILKDNMLINLGESFLVVNLVSTPECSPPKLSLKMYTGSAGGEVWSFHAAQHVNSHILVGRSLNCNIKIEDPLLSKIQCSVFYNPVSGWTLMDGDVGSQKSSTNGTWLYLNEDFEIYNGMIFKSNQTLFQAMLIWGS